VSKGYGSKTPLATSSNEDIFVHYSAVSIATDNINIT